jgi:hypothetical protein
MPSPCRHDVGVVDGRCLPGEYKTLSTPARWRNDDHRSVRADRLPTDDQSLLEDRRSGLAGSPGTAAAASPPSSALPKPSPAIARLILNAVEHGLSNARSGATNTHLRLFTRRAYGYHSPDSLIAMADLTRGGLCPPFPGRS